MNQKTACTPKATKKERFCQIEKKRMRDERKSLWFVAISWIMHLPNDLLNEN